MPTTREELDRFHQFAAERIGTGESPLEFDDLVTEWMDRKEQSDIRAILDRAIADIKAGNLGRPAREVTEELRQKYGIPAT